MNADLKLSKPVVNSASSNLTDTGNANRFVNLHRHVVRYCYQWKVWLTFNGRHWERSKDRPIELAKLVCRELYREAAQTEDDAARKALTGWGRASESAARIQALLQLAQSIPGIPITPEELDTDPMLLCCPNGTLDLRTGILRPHSPSDLITRCSPVPYCPEATCPTWENFLSQVFLQDKELIAYIKRLIGYCLTGRTSERCIFVFHGVGRNGKTTFQQVLSALLGPDLGLKLPTESILQRRQGTASNDLAMLRGVRMAWCSEIDDERHLAESRIKEITGDESITARFLYSEFFEFRPVCKIIIATNHRPTVSGTDEGLWDRLRVIPFNFRIPKSQVNQNLRKALHEELPGILRWAVEGCIEWQKSGLAEPDTVLNAVKAYRKENDMIGVFLAERCELGEGLKVHTTKLFQAYVQYSDDQRLNSQVFNAAIKKRGFEKPRKSSGAFWWEGVALKPDNSDVSDQK